MVSTCTAGSSKMDFAYTSDVILTKFRPKGITIFLRFSLSCMYFQISYSLDTSLHKSPSLNGLGFGAGTGSYKPVYSINSAS